MGGIFACSNVERRRVTLTLGVVHLEVCFLHLGVCSQLVSRLCNDYQLHLQIEPFSFAFHLLSGNHCIRPKNAERLLGGRDVHGCRDQKHTALNNTKINETKKNKSIYA